MKSKVNWRVKEIGIFIKSNEDQLKFLKEIVSPLMKKHNNMFFFFEGEGELRIRASKNVIAHLEKVAKQKKLSYIRRPYSGEAEFYGKKGWKFSREMFHEVSKNGLSVMFDGLEKDVDFYARRYVHLLLNCMNYSYTAEIKFHIAQAIRKMEVATVFWLCHTEERTLKVLMFLRKLHLW